ncbi:MAG TPA: flagellar basal-body MS-ring/collar protein FliF [Symbiobacteriaceae bacterium]|nr:flagellar basal-body MS-ring/collar protein FliF [Symbiobacteriaceae bacterium]
MASLATNTLGRMKETWGRMNPAQRWLTGGLGLALAGAIATATYLNRTQYVVLVSRADPRDAAAIVARLNELKVPYRPTGDSTITIEVPQKEQYTAKLALAQAGLPRGDTVGMEIFDEPAFGATEFDRKVNLLRAQQGELERALMRMAELEYANVKLAIPERSVFTRDQQPVTASVLVQPRSGRRLTPEQVVGVVSFIANAVQGLSPENVKVVDQTGRLLSNGITAEGSFETAGLDSDQLQRQMQMQRDLEQRVQTLLEPIFGPGNVVARVNLELNNETSRIENTTVGGSTPRASETTREAAQGRSAAPAGTTDPNSPPVYQGDTSTNTNNDLWRTSTTTDYAVSERKEVTLVAPGSVRKISVGIAVNQPDITAERVKMIQDMVAGATGAERAFVSVAAIQFNQDLPSQIASVSTPVVAPATLAIGLGSAAAVLLAGFFLTRRRESGSDLDDSLDMQPQLVGMAPVEGTALDVALGLDPAPQVAMGELPAGTPPAMEPVRYEPVPGGGSGSSTPKQRLELIMASRPRRQIVLDGQPVDEELMALVNDLIDTSPEASAEMIRQWLKGGG